ncbi:MAG TPA: hypothetical protein VM734_12600 [Kofleriaceae bacterium]|jgi:hypothetical protein|nr:hypothetical protein [Kofleriaceae bacterium]
MSHRLRSGSALAWLTALAIVLVAAPADARRKKPKKKVKPATEEPAPKDDATGADTPDEPDGGAPPPAPAMQPDKPEPPPPPAPPPLPVAETKAAAVDVDGLRQEYLKLRDELFESRARASTVSSALYSTRIQVKLTFTTGRFYGVNRATVRLDGASVYDDTAGAIAGDDAVRFDGWIAPGRHVLTFRVETVGKDDERFTSATETTVVVQAVAGKDLSVAARASDGGDIAYEWKRKERGSYKLGIDVDVRTSARAAEDKRAGKK